MRLLYLSVTVIAVSIVPCARTGGKLVFCRYPTSGGLKPCEGSVTLMVFSQGDVEAGKCYAYPEVSGGSKNERMTNGKSFCVHSYKNTATSTSFVISHLCPKSYATQMFDVANTVDIVFCDVLYDPKTKACKWTSGRCDANNEKCGGCLREIGNCTKSHWVTYSGSLNERIIVTDSGEKVSVSVRDSQFVKFFYFIDMCACTLAMTVDVLSYFNTKNALKRFTHTVTRHTGVPFTESKCTETGLKGDTSGRKTFDIVLIGLVCVSMSFILW